MNHVVYNIIQGFQNKSSQLFKTFYNVYADMRDAFKCENYRNDSMKQSKKLKLQPLRSGLCPF